MPVLCKECSKQATYGFKDSGKYNYCKEHKKEGMVNIKDEICSYKDCINRAHPLGNTKYCIKHGGGLRCKYKDCKNSIRRSIDDYCISHGGGKRCKEDGCKNGSLGKTDFCRKHGGGKRCDYKDCNKSSLDNTGFCANHGGGQRCKYNECESLARSKSDFCVLHGGGKRCPNCIDWIDSRCGSSKYDGYCATCFKVIFPDDERSKVIYRHTKEVRVRNEINSHFEGFIHDKPLYTGNCDCTHRRRIDHRKLIGNTILAIETDEFGHSGYDPLDEEIRYDDLYMIHSGKWIFIRFNPDGGKVDLFPIGKRSYEVAIEDKLKVLIREIEEQIRRIENEENEGLLEIVKLYY